MNTFKFRFIARVILLIATCLFFAYLVLESKFIFIPAIVALIIIFEIISLFIFTDKTNRDLSRFLLSIKYDDTSQAFSGAGLGSSFGELKDAFRQVMQKLGESRSEMQARTRYLDTIIHYVGVGRGGGGGLPAGVRVQVGACAAGGLPLLTPPSGDGYLLGSPSSAASSLHY